MGTGEAAGERGETSENVEDENVTLNVTKFGE